MKRFSPTTLRRSGGAEGLGPWWAEVYLLTVHTRLEEGGRRDETVPRHCYWRGFRPTAGAAFGATEFNARFSINRLAREYLETPPVSRLVLSYRLLLNNSECQFPASLPRDLMDSMSPWNMLRHSGKQCLNRTSTLWQSTTDTGRRHGSKTVIVIGLSTTIGGVRFRFQPLPALLAFDFCTLNTRRTALLAPSKLQGRCYLGMSLMSLSFVPSMDNSRFFSSSAWKISNYCADKGLSPVDFDSRPRRTVTTD